MIRIVPLKFQQAGRQYDFNAQALELKTGDRVIVETDRGRAMATVVLPPREIPKGKAPEGLKNILRLATEEDIALAETNAAREKDAHRYCAERIHERRLEMKLVRAEYAFDGSKIIFYFTADGRIDFRELVKDLAHHFHTRIEMRQIGVRDEAKLVGGLGICGRELCCRSFLTQFNPVSVKMAKEQGLALNPTKISGQCGRLLCCLGYEFDTYSELRKGMPKCGKKVVWQERECEVTAQDILRQRVTLRDRDGSCCCVTLEELRTGQAAPAAPAEPATGETHANRLTRGRPQRQEQKKPAGRGQQPAEREASDETRPTRQGKPPRPRPPKPPRPPQGAPAEAPQGQQAPPQGQAPADAAAGQPQGKRRRRGRRRPRGGRKPGPETQGQ